ncbi:hypothetical protein [Kaistia sp. MMO-174]|uniref:hypothetical protein n=1 Tax=Kaistia sp. MMO-174 TaxID=3081256 RepID=UPI00301B09D4
MANGGKKGADKRQGDLFAYADMYPVRQPTTAMRPLDLSLRIKTAMGRALKECPLNATQVAAAITEMTGRELTADALYTYTAPTKPEHEIGITRFVAFVRATGATWLWDVLVEDDGLIVLEGEEAHLAQRGLLEQQVRQLQDEIKGLDRKLREEPVKVATHRRRRV